MASNKSAQFDYNEWSHFPNFPLQAQPQALDFPELQF
jgi:hypothetical protein